MDRALGLGPAGEGGVSDRRRAIALHARAWAASRGHRIRYDERWELGGTVVDDEAAITSTLPARLRIDTPAGLLVVKLELEAATASVSYGRAVRLSPRRSEAFATLDALAQQDAA